MLQKVEKNLKENLFSDILYKRGHWVLNLAFTFEERRLKTNENSKTNREKNKRKKTQNTKHPIVHEWVRVLLVPLPYDLVPHLSKKLCKLPQNTSSAELRMRWLYSLQRGKTSHSPQNKGVPWVVNETATNGETLVMEIWEVYAHCHYSQVYSDSELSYLSYLPTPPLGQGMTQGQFLSGV